MTAVKYLLDTHILLWWLDKDSPLKPGARAIIDDPSVDITISVVSVWEINIKQALGKYKSPDDLLYQIKSNDMHVLPVTIDHADAIRFLPRLHGDPFDRMLIMQAMLEDLTIITHDKDIEAYSVSCLMV